MTTPWNAIKEFTVNRIIGPRAIVNGYTAPLWNQGGESVSEDDFNSAIDAARYANVVMACVDWKATMATRCPWMLEEQTDDGWEGVEQSPVLDLLNNPTEHHGGAELLAAAMTQWCLYGESYWLRVGDGIPEGLVWQSPEAFTPKVDADGWLSHYEYRVQGRITRLEPEQVVHLRYASDELWNGISPLRSLGRQIWTDQEAARATAAVLKNMGIVGPIIVPSDKEIEFSDGDVRSFREYLAESYTGARRGSPLALGFAANVYYPPQVLTEQYHKGLHDHAEERVCAIFRIPPSVVGFGTGLEQSRVGATMQEQERQAWETGLLPDLAMIANQASRQLLPAFGLDYEKYRLNFDLNEIRVLQEDENRKAEMWKGLVNAGLATRGEARAAFNLEVTDSDDVYLMPVSVIEQPRGMSQLETSEMRADAMGLPVGQQVGQDNSDDEEDDDENENPFA